MKLNEFTKDELFEIEKVFDSLAGQFSHATADILTKLSLVKANKLKNKILEESVITFDIYRTISTKCQKARTGL